MFCCFQNIKDQILLKSIQSLRLWFFLLFIFLPSIKKTNFDNIPPKKGTHNFS